MSRPPEQERFEMAMDLCDLAESMLRQKIRRTHPELPEADVEARVDRWFLESAGGSLGDADGVPILWPRKRP